jgi:serine protease Do
MPFHRHLGLLCAAILLASLGIACPVAFAEEPAAEAVDAAEKAYLDALERARSIERSLVKAVAKVRINSVAVLNLRKVKRPGQPEPIMQRVSGGSGVIIQAKSKLWILTNVHVTANNQALQVVTHDGVTRDVILHDSIPEYDIALLRFKETPRRVKFRGVRVNASYSEKGLKEGTWVIATGNPFFLGEDGASVTTLGVISGMDRFLGGKYQYVGAIQHDAEVNPGNSGGPLWNLKGQFVGINGKIATGQRLLGVRPTSTGAAFSLPAHQIQAYLKQLMGDGDAEAGYLGVQTETVKDKKGKAVGARILKIDKRSPLAKGKGVPKKGDVITSLAVKGVRKTVYTASDLRELLSRLTAGTEISLAFKSGKRSKRWKGKLGDKGR